VRQAVYVSLAACVFVASAAAADPVRDRQVPIEIDRHGGIAVSVAIDGTGPYVFLLDTGSARTVVADDLAASLRAPAVAQTEVVASGGSERHVAVRLQSIAVGAMRVASVVAPVVPRGRLEAIRPGLRGLLGQDFLSAFNYTLDYRHRLLRQDEVQACTAREAVPLTRADGRFVAAAAVAGVGQVRLVPDTGAEITVLFGGPTAGAPMLVTSLTGGSTGQIQRIDQLRVGRVTVSPLTALISTRDEASADGLLPMHLFSSVSFAANGACMVPRG
jgi:predicted aspartyl protease